jgi:hypothetical protein
MHRQSQDGKEWVGFPARSYADKSGSTSWHRVIEFAQGASYAREQFRKRALEAIHAALEHENAEVRP